MTSDRPAIQLIANLIVEREPDDVLLARYDPTGEIDEHDAETRWWLPAHELDPYQHPDEAAHIALEQIGGLTVTSFELTRIQSFRGRRGWHISFDYLIRASGEPASNTVAAAWHPINDLPATMHGNWERETITEARTTKPNLP